MRLVESEVSIKQGSGMRIINAHALTFLLSFQNPESKYFLKLKVRVLPDNATVSDGVGLGVRVTSR